MRTATFVYRRRVEFAETDMAGILHFANYFRFMEECEHAFFRSLGLRIHHETKDGFRGFARGECACRYEAPLRYEDEVELHLRCVEVRDKALRYEIDFLLDKAIVARGSVTAVYVGNAGAGDGGSAEPRRIRAYPLPEAVKAAIEGNAT